ncbi:MAG TPA: hypothetical protein VFS67_24890 [Polyangiaceae bacterium]|nr:hypothetical protein [Polyangiaceae bacterium]
MAWAAEAGRARGSGSRALSAGLLLCALGGGCAGLWAPAPPASALRVLSVESSADMNDATALMLDVVFLYDAKLADSLPKSAPEWFAQRDDLRRQYAGKLDVLPLQMTVQDATGRLALSERRKRAQAVLVFANYLAQGAQVRTDISGCHWARVVLLREVWVVAEAWSGPYWNWKTSGSTEHDSRCGS